MATASEIVTATPHKVGTCFKCATPVRPNKMRCDKCLPIELDRLLDIRNRSTSAHSKNLADRVLVMRAANVRKVT